MQRSFAMLCTLGLLATGCRSGHVKVQHYWGTTTERLPVGSTFDWWRGGETPRPPAEQPDESLDRLVRESVEAELAALGFQKRSSDGAPDFMVSLHLGRGFQPSPRGPEDRGTLAVEVFDGPSGRLLYRGWADAAVDPTLTPEVRKARLRHAVHEVIEPLRPYDGR